MGSSAPYSLVNGKPDNHVAVTDRGLAYGDGVFETMLCIDGRVPLLNRHLNRLNHACRVLGLSAPSQEQWQHDLDTLFAAHPDSGRSIIKLMVTRGSGGFGYAPPKSATPTRIVHRLDYPQSIVSDELSCDFLETCLGSNRQLAGIKHLNRIEQVLAANELGRRKLQEGLVCNQYGFVIEAVSSNVILVFGKRVVTPKLDTAGVKGIMRDALIEATSGTQAQIRKEYVHRDVVAQADEIILCNSVRGVRRLSHMGKRSLKRRAVFDELANIATQLLDGQI